MSSCFLNILFHFISFFDINLLTKSFLLHHLSEKSHNRKEADLVFVVFRGLAVS